MPNPRENHARMEGSRSMGFRSPRMPRFISGTTWELLKAHTQSHDQRCGGWGGGQKMQLRMSLGVKLFPPMNILHLRTIYMAIIYRNMKQTYKSNIY